jgi:protein CpxP
MKRTLMTFAATGLLAAGMAFAQPPAARHQHAQRMAQALNLTDAQKAEAKSMFQQTRQATQPVRDQLKQTRQELAAAVKANDTAAIERLSAKQGQLMGRLTAARTEAMAKFYQTLTPEQKTKADQLHQNMRQRRWKNG